MKRNLDTFLKLWISLVDKLKIDYNGDTALKIMGDTSLDPE